MDHNPHLKPWHKARPNQVAGKGRIETPESSENIVWQTRAAPPSPYENELAQALIDCFESGIEDLEPLIARLNEMGVVAPDGTPWTAEVFEHEMARLGN